MIFTVGHEENYRKAIAQYGVIQKMGETIEYQGGIVFETYEDAERHLKALGHQDDWCVWGVDADWITDTYGNADEGCQYLLFDKDIIDLAKK